MKKIIFAVVAALAITSCSESEEFEVSSQSAEIKVGTIIKKTTKAVITDNSNFLSFKLHSYVVDVSSIAEKGLGAAYMNGILYERPDKNSTWMTADPTKYYWPLEAKMQFFAYPSTITDFGLPKEPSKGYPFFTFTVKGTAATQNDLVVAYQADVIKPVDNTLNIDFKHVLTRVNFSYVPGDLNYTYQVKEITIVGVKGGTATYTYNAGKGSWGDGSEDKVSYKYLVNDKPEAVEGVFALDVENGSLMLLPQQVAGKTIVIDYEVAKNKITYFNVGCSV